MEGHLDSWTPEELVSKLGQFCTVSFQPHVKYQGGNEGYLYTIDPRSNTLILFNEQGKKALVVMSHAIASLMFDPNRSIDLETMDAFLPYPGVESLVSESWLTQRREALVDYLQKQRIEVESNTDDRAIKVLGCARIEPPYVATSVYSDNPRVLESVRKVVMELSW